MHIGPAYDTGDTYTRGLTVPELIDAAGARLSVGSVGQAWQRARHLWVLPLIFHIDDPEAAMDSMELGEENLLGPGLLLCLLCRATYRHALLDSTCPGR